MKLKDGAEGNQVRQGKSAVTAGFGDEILIYLHRWLTQRRSNVIVRTDFPV